MKIEKSGLVIGLRNVKQKLKKRIKTMKMIKIKIKLKIDIYF